MLRASVRLSVCLFPKSSETTERIHFKFAISDMQLCISVDTSNCYPFTFSVKKITNIRRTETYSLSLERQSNNQCTEYNQ